MDSMYKFVIGSCVVLFLGLWLLAKYEGPEISRDVAKSREQNMINRVDRETKPKAYVAPAPAPQPKPVPVPLETVKPEPPPEPKPLPKPEPVQIEPAIKRRKLDEPTPVGVEPIRQWIDASGKHSIDAQFVSFEDESKRVTLRMKDEKTKTIPLHRLSAYDGIYVTQRHALYKRAMDDYDQWKKRVRMMRSAKARSSARRAVARDAAARSSQTAMALGHTNQVGMGYNSPDNVYRDRLARVNQRPRFEWYCSRCCRKHPYGYRH